MKTFEEIREGHLAEEEKKGLAGKSEKSKINVFKILVIFS